MSNIFSLNKPPVTVRRVDDDWIVRVIRNGMVTEQRFDNQSSATMVAETLLKLFDGQDMVARMDFRPKQRQTR